MNAPSPDERECIEIFDSQGDAYRQAFETFLDHTDQKERARQRLVELADGLEKRRVLIDAGAGNGKVTAWLVDRFERTIALEPNPHLRSELQQTCAAAEVQADGILAASPAAKGDFVLCSHVLYYLDRADWLPALTKLAGWMSPQGALAVIIQNHQSDCSRMVEHFYRPGHGLAELAGEFAAASGDRYHVELETVPSRIETDGLAAAAAIAEFILNSPPKPAGKGEQPVEELPVPRRADVARYLHEHFTRAGGGFRWSCDQDFLIVRPRG